MGRVSTKVGRKEIRMKDIFNRSQMARMNIVEGILESILEEFEHGGKDMNIMQTAVNCQVDINRIVFILNKAMEEE